MLLYNNIELSIIYIYKTLINNTKIYISITKEDSI